MRAKIQLLFFASLAERLNCAEEQLELPEEVDSVNALRLYLIDRGAPWNVLASDQVRCAVNQEIATIDYPIRPGDEVAFFPPVTGG